MSPVVSEGVALTRLGMPSKVLMTEGMTRGPKKRWTTVSLMGVLLAGRVKRAFSSFSAVMRAREKTMGAMSLSLGVVSWAMGPRTVGVMAVRAAGPVYFATVE